jgi:hypothetical protein
MAANASAAGTGNGKWRTLIAESTRGTTAGGWCARLTTALDVAAVRGCVRGTADDGLVCC